MLPLDVFSETPWLVMNADRFNALLESSLRTLPPPMDGGVVSIDDTNVTETLASTKMRMFVMMSRYGTTLSSPASSPASGSLGCERRRIFDRCAELSGTSCGSAMG